MMDNAIQTQTEVQAETKAGYDKHAKELHFDVGDQVLVPMPVTSIKLTAQWTGPYLVENKLSPVRYVVRMPDKRKKTHTIHQHDEAVVSASSGSILHIGKTPRGVY